MIAFLIVVAIADGVIIARRLVSARPRQMNLVSLILGIAYGLIALATIESSASLIGGSLVMFTPIVLWLLRVILFGTRVNN